jgi:hypothetical protein
VLTRREQDFLLRQVEAFCQGILSELGLREADDDEDDLDELETEAESWLGFPLDLVRGMDLDSLLAFLGAGGQVEPERMLLVGLVFAARATRSGTREASGLRLHALGLLSRAIEARPGLLDDHVGAVLGTLTGAGGDAMPRPAHR